MICRTCNTDKEFTEFQFMKNKYGSGSYRLECKECRKPKTHAACKNWYENNKKMAFEITRKNRERRTHKRKCEVCRQSLSLSLYRSLSDTVCTACRKSSKAILE